MESCEWVLADMGVRPWVDPGKAIIDFLFIVAPQPKDRCCPCNLLTVSGSTQAASEATSALKEAISGPG